MTTRERADRAIQRCLERDGSEPATQHIGPGGNGIPGACPDCIEDAITAAIEAARRPARLRRLAPGAPCPGCDWCRP